MKKMIPNLMLLAAFLFVFSGCSLPQEADNAENSLEVVDDIHFSVISNTALTFDWTGTEDYISYGTDPEDLASTVTAVHPEFLPVTSPWVSAPGPYWEAKLTGLEVNTLYYYKIGTAGKMHKFRTPPLPGEAGFRVCLTSDMHDRSAECVAMFYQISL